MHFTTDTVTVITGSGRGLGLQFVKQILGTTDSTVVATARSLSTADQLHELVKRFSKRLHLVTMDTSDESSIKVTHTCRNVYIVDNTASLISCSA